MRITNEWLKEKDACKEGVDWFNKQKETNSIKILNKLIKEDELDWANWLIVRVMKYEGYVSYAVFAAEQVIDIYEKKHPNDDKPRKAIEAARKCIKSPTDKNKKAADAAAYADAAADAAYAAAYAAYAAAYAADAAAYAAYAADAAAAAAAARKETRLKILNYGIKYLRDY